MNHYRLLRLALGAVALLYSARLGAQELSPVAVLRPSLDLSITRFAAYLQVHENVLAVGGDRGATLFTRTSPDGQQWSPVVEHYRVNAAFGAEVDLDDERVMADEFLWSRTPGGGAPFQSVTLSPSDRSAHAQAGEGVALEGDIAVVGAGNNDFQGRQSVGTVSIFQRLPASTVGFTELTTFTPADVAPGDDFGDNVSLDGGTLVASATSHAATGAVYVFERNAGGVDAWGQTAKLMPSIVTAPRSFGSDVELDADQLIVGAGKGVGLGQAFIYQRDAAGDWIEAARLLPPSSHEGDRFGYAVDISSDLAVVAAPSGLHPISAEREALAYVYQRNRGGPDAWGLAAILRTPPEVDPEQFETFGQSVAIMGSNVLVGAMGLNPGRPGAVFVYSVPEPHSFALAAVAIAATSWVQKRLARVAPGQQM